MKAKTLVILLLLYTGVLYAHSPEEQLKKVIDSFYRAHPNAVGIMVNIESQPHNISWSYATGYSNKNLKSPIHADQPALTASNTKTYLSAALLKLVEQRKLDLEQPIGSIITKQSAELLTQAGYDLQKIKIKHLLSHTSGIADYVDDNYFQFVDKNKTHRWTREEQIKLAATIGKPLAPPGDTFKYADVNYLLASEIIEHVTAQPFYNAIANLLQFRKNKLHTTWFVTLQKRPKQSNSLVHQYYEKFGWDSYDLDPSWDLYGGGGIATTVTDLSRFFQLLFEGKIVKDTALIAKMRSPIYSNTNYGLGIRKIDMNGSVGYYHGGWWGTDAIYFPELKTAVTIYILERNEKSISSEICKRILDVLKQERSTSEE